MRYLGPYGTKASRVEYDGLVMEWLAAGRPSHQAADPGDVTVSEICAAFWKFAKVHYVKHDTRTGGQ
jgi:hypothetical protein